MDESQSKIALSFELINGPSLLIRCGLQDEAHCYWPALGPMTGLASVIVYFHPSSIILERVRILGLMAVIVEWNSLRFSAELKLCDPKNNLSDRQSLELALHEPLALEEAIDQPLIPLT